jgi:predicted proteasome-type protease
VGPSDLAVYVNGSFELEEFRIAAGSPVLVELQHTWEHVLRSGFDEPKEVNREALHGGPER